MRDVESTRQLFELFPAQMQDRAEAGGAIGEIPRTLPDQRDEALHVGGGKGRMHREHDRRDSDLADGGEILDRVVGHLLVQSRVDGVGGHGRHQQGVPVGHRLCDQIGADIAAGARLVLHQELLAEERSQFSAQDARDRVSWPARRKGDHDAHRLRWIDIRARACAGKCEHQEPRYRLGRYSVIAHA